MSPSFSEVDTMLITTASVLLLMLLHNLAMSAEYLYLFFDNGPSSQEQRFLMKYSYSKELFSLAVLKSPEAIVILLSSFIMAYVKTLLSLMD